MVFQPHFYGIESVIPTSNFKNMWKKLANSLEQNKIIIIMMVDIASYIIYLVNALFIICHQRCHPLNLEPICTLPSSALHEYSEISFHKLKKKLERRVMLKRERIERKVLKHKISQLERGVIKQKLWIFSGIGSKYLIHL